MKENKEILVQFRIKSEKVTYQEGLLIFANKTTQNISLDNSTIIVQIRDRSLKTSFEDLALGSNLVDQVDSEEEKNKTFFEIFNKIQD
jgi:hypothetical protein